MNASLTPEEIEMQLKELEARKKELETRKKEERKKMRSPKNGGLIALCIILIILVAGLSVVLLFSIKHTQDKVSELNGTIEQLNKEIKQTKNKFAECNSDLTYYKNVFTQTRDKLTEANALTTQQSAKISSLEATIQTLKQKLAQSDPTNVKYSYSFDSVSTLLSAIKKNPNEYVNKQVKVVGTAYNTKTNGVFETVLFDMSSSESFPDTPSSEFEIENHVFLKRKRENGELITIEITDEVMLTVLESGDYIKLYGTVRVANGEIYLDWCSYDRISSYK
jgi:hypothetical protein